MRPGRLLIALWYALMATDAPETLAGQLRAQAAAPQATHAACAGHEGCRCGTVRREQKQCCCLRRSPKTPPVQTSRRTPERDLVLLAVLAGCGDDSRPAVTHSAGRPFAFPPVVVAWSLPEARQPAGEHSPSAPASAGREPLDKVPIV